MKKKIWNNGNILLRKLQNWLNLGFPRFEVPHNWDTSLWGQELDLLVVVFLEASKCSVLGQLPRLGWPSIVAHGNPHGETSGLPRNLRLCCASLFFLHFIRSALRQIHPWKKGSAGIKIKSLLTEKLFCYLISDISTLNCCWVAGRMQHGHSAALGRLLLVGMLFFEWLRTYILASSNY